MVQNNALLVYYLIFYYTGVEFDDNQFTQLQVLYAQVQHDI